MSNSKTEQWKVIEAHPNYMVSTLGRVKSIARICRSGPPPGIREVKEKILSAWVSNGTGYLELKLDRKTCLVHRLVLETFVGPRPQDHVCAHWDGDRTNPTLSNLRWATYGSNNNDMERHGTKCIGERNRLTKLTADQVRAIRKDSRTRRAISKDYGVTPEAISHIMLGKNWKWLK